MTSRLLHAFRNDDQALAPLAGAISGIGLGLIVGGIFHPKILVALLMTGAGICFCVAGVKLIRRATWLKQARQRRGDWR